MVVYLGEVHIHFIRENQPSLGVMVPSYIGLELCETRLYWRIRKVNGSARLAPKGGNMQIDIAKAVVATKEDEEVNRKALAALSHYYLHKDSMPLTRLVLKLPNSNRRIALLEWIQKFSVLQWDRTRATLVRRKIPERQDIDAATVQPFWSFKIKQEQRRHVSGNTFEPDLFFDRVLADIRANIGVLSSVKLESAIVELQKLAAEKRAMAGLQK